MYRLVLRLTSSTHLALLFVGGVTAHTEAWADPSTAIVIDPMVVTGAYAPTSSFDLPFSVDTVDLSNGTDGQLGVNLSEVLTKVPGLVVQNRQNYAQDLQISSRGFGARSAFGVRGIKLLSDGIPASTPDGQGQAATLNLDVADRIEVLRGPAATLYGSNAGGVIQMFSRDGEGPARLGAETTFGSDGFSKHHLSAQGGNEIGGFVLDASRMDTDGYRDHSAAKRDQTFAKVHIKPDADSRLALIYSSLEQNNTQDPLGQLWSSYKHDPRSVADGARAYNTRKSIDHQQVGMNYERYVGDATLQFNLYAGRRSVVQYLSIPRPDSFNRQREAGLSGSERDSNSQRGGGVVDFDREFHGGTLRWIQPVLAVPGHFTFTVGADYDQSTDDRRGYQNFRGDQLGVKGELKRDEKDIATSLDPYVQARWEIGNWTSELGVRYSTMKMKVDDHYLENGDASGAKRYQQANPTLSVMYAFTPDLRGYASLGKGFETPTQAEMAYAPGLQESFNFGLEPATSKQYELGVKYRLGAATRLNAALFEIRTDNEIVVDNATNGRTSYHNAGQTVRRGFEASLQSDLAERWQTTWVYTHTDARYADDFKQGGQVIDSGNRLPGVPRDNLYAEVVWKPTTSVSMGFEGQYRSKVFVEDSNQQKAAPAYAVFNWRTRFEQQVGPWTFHQLVRLDNLFDRQYVGSVIVGDSNKRYYEAAPGRSWYAGAGLEYQFR